MSEITVADLKWLLTFVENYQLLLETEPSWFSDEDEDDMRIAKQILQEKINEDTNPRHRNGT